MKYASIARHRGEYPVRLMCRVLGVSPAGFYARAAAAAQCARAGGPALAARGARRRTRRATALRGAADPPGAARAGHRRAAGTRRAPDAGRWARGRGARGAFASPPQSAHRGSRGAQRLARQFAVGAHTERDRVWAADLTYLATGEGWLYLAVVLDLASRRVVGWVRTRDSIRRLPLRALQMALRAAASAAGALHHSDRGVQYASAAYQAAARGPRHHVQHEPAGRLLGQRGGRELLRHAQDGARCDRRPWATRAEVAARGVPLHRRVVQLSAPSPNVRLSYARAVRTRSAQSELTPPSTKSGQLHSCLLLISLDPYVRCFRIALCFRSVRLTRAGPRKCRDGCAPPWPTAPHQTRARRAC